MSSYFRESASDHEEQKNKKHYSEDTVLDEGRLLQIKQLNLEKEMAVLYQTIESLLPNSAKIIQFIASRKGEGTSTIAREYAQISSELYGKSVLLLDPALAPPAKRLDDDETQHSLIHSEPHIPVERLFCPAENQHFFIGTVSMFGKSLSTVFSSQKSDLLLDKLKQNFDLTVIASPPLTLSPDGLSVARKVDGVVMVLEAETTRCPVVADLKNKIENVGGNILGIILNKQKHYIPSFIYDHL